jgi:biopolymer transport protein TolQ
MHSDLSIASLILGASLLVKCVMLALVLASIASWALVFRKRRELLNAKRAAAAFEDQFWAAEDLTGSYCCRDAGVR